MTAEYYLRGNLGFKNAVKGYTEAIEIKSDYVDALTTMGVYWWCKEIVREREFSLMMS
jgi:hypothetical protein